MSRRREEAGKDEQVKAAIKEVLAYCKGNEARYKLEVACWIRNTYAPCRQCGHKDDP